MTDKTGGAAFPSTRKIDRRNGQDWDGMRKEDLREVVTPGMSLRDYFAAKAMQGLLASPAMGDSNLHDSADDWLKDIAECSYEFADAMLKVKG